MIFDVLTIFPEIIESYVHSSIVGKAVEKGIVQCRVHNIRDYTHDRHKQVDDCPFGGGAGMVIKAAPVIEAVESIQRDGKDRKVLLMSPQGVPFTQRKAEELKDAVSAIVLICGRYEGIDERVKYVVDEEVSIGDYILTGGELAALVIIDGVVRLLPGALGDESSSREESFSWGILDYPHYTRPRRFRGMDVPEVLVSGNHKDITLWRREQALRNTLLKRPDLLDTLELDKTDKELLERIKEELHHAQDKGD